jgi:ZIP family zinc transporter
MLAELERVATASPFLTGLGASVLAGAGATALGAAPITFIARLSETAINLLLSFAAGVMLAATMFSLLLPGLDAGAVAYGSSGSAILIVTSLTLGGFTLWVAHRRLPHEHFCKGCEGGDARRFARIWLLIIAITIHNFPEGLAVGVGAASGDLATGLGVTLGIGLQNMPEGLAVATGLLALGYGRGLAFLAAAATGLVEPMGGAVGAFAVAASAQLLPWALGFAGGAMLFVISSEVIPETHRPGFERGATAALFAGFSTMFLLSAVLK